MDVEREYRVRVDAMSVVERVRRAEALFRWSRAYLVRAILETRGPLSERELAHELAIRLYGSDPHARPMIEALRADAQR